MTRLVEGVKRRFGKAGSAAEQGADPIDVFRKLRDVAVERRRGSNDRKESLTDSIASLNALILALGAENPDIDQLRTIEACPDFIPDGFPIRMQGIEAAKDIVIALSKAAGVELESVYGVISANTQKYAQRILDGYHGMEVYEIINRLNDESGEDVDFELAISFVNKLSKSERPSKEEMEFTASVWEYVNSKGLNKEDELPEGDFNLIQEMASALYKRIPAEEIVEKPNADVEQNDVSL